MTDSFRVIAIISAFNEEDVIFPVIGRLIENGVDVYLIDNRSTDATVSEASRWLGRGLLQIESFPPDGSGNAAVFDWEGILRRKEELAQSLKADWFIHHDADEIREGPWPGLTLKEAIRRVDTLGYNCIDFRVFNFAPIDDGFKKGDDPYAYFASWEEAAHFDVLQLKAWKAGSMRVSLHREGGHDVRFEGRNVFPVKFILRHYPIRGQSHGRKKVFEERKKRFLTSEHDKGWHIQYDQIVEVEHRFLADPAKLRPFHLDQVRIDLFMADSHLQELSALRMQSGGAQKGTDGMTAECDALRAQVQELHSSVQCLKGESEALLRHALNVEDERASLRERIASLEVERDALRAHAKGQGQ